MAEQLQTLLNDAERAEVAVTFAEDDTAKCYVHRAPYAPALYRRVLDLTERRHRALDVGCGPGKVARVLADHFDDVIALDPAAAMLAVGQVADSERHPNITWVCAHAEDFEDARGFDLVTAGSSIHWPDHAKLFPKLTEWTGLVAVIDGDSPSPHPCGEGAWLAFLKPWLERMAEQTPGIRRPYDPVASRNEASRHEAWMDISGRESFPFVFRQSLEDFIACQHSRATWSRAAMGPDLSDQFDAELDALMRPFAVHGWLELQMVSNLVWGAPRRIRRT